MAAKKKFNRAQTKKLLPGLRAFNKVARILIGVLTKQVEKKEKSLNTIRVMVNSDFVPKGQHHDISITTLDMNQTRVKKSGQVSYNQKMDWEKDFMKNKNRGQII
jgi:hypothetical protein